VTDIVADMSLKLNIILTCFAQPAVSVYTHSPYCIVVAF